MSRTSTPHTSPVLALARWAMIALAACGDAPPTPGDIAPTITISGVADGQTSDAPLTIAISVDRGSFTAQLNGETFFSGRTVSAPGSYLLEVTARNGDAVSSRAIDFSIVLTGDSRLIIRMFDLGANESGGGGDALLVTDSSGAGMRHALFDAGPSGIAGSDREFVWRQLDALGVDTLEALVLSHAHTDHFDGMGTVLDRITVRRFIYNGQVRNLGSYNALISNAQGRADTVIVPAAVSEFVLGFGPGATTLAVLPPLSTFLTTPNPDGSQINEGSLGTEVSKAGFRLFVTGDGEVAANTRWRTQYAARTAGLSALKVGHHGANDAVFDNGGGGTSTWLAHAAPELAIISANGTSHPRVNAINQLLGMPQTRTYCTNVHGDIEIRVGDAGVFSVTVERNAGADCVPGTDATT